MSTVNIQQIENHIRTHTERSAEDRAAISLLETFLRSDGKINTNFSCDDKWPNTDGTFEFVPEPSISRRPEQNFVVQVKGTHSFNEVDGVVKYSLKSLAFPAFIYKEVTLDPGILFVVLNPDVRGRERVFWKYMSVDFINSIDYSHNSATISFTLDEEIKNTDESIEKFCSKLKKITEHHSFVKKLENVEHTRKDIEGIIEICNGDIVEDIEKLEIYNETRDNVSRKMLSRLNDLCSATLLLNACDKGYDKNTLQLAWEYSLLNIETKYLGTFLRGLKYIGNRLPEKGQSERLMLKYYDFLWQMRKFLQEKYNISILNNLEKFPHDGDSLDQQYYDLISQTISNCSFKSNNLGTARYYVQKKTPFYIGTERYYEVTLQLSGIYATKYNRITAYTKENISTNYSIKVAYQEENIDLWGIDCKIKVITNWQVSIDPTCLNKMAKILKVNTKISSNFGEYNSLMIFLTKTGINLLDFVDLEDGIFNKCIEEIFEKTNTALFKDIILLIRRDYGKGSDKRGKNVIRYLLLHLREDDFEKVMPNQFTQRLLCDYLHLSSRCFPFEKRPFLSNLVGSLTTGGNSISNILNVAGAEEFNVMKPYLTLKNQIKNTGEIYFESDVIDNIEEIDSFNKKLDGWEQTNGYKIEKYENLVYIDSYEKSTLEILCKLLEMSKCANAGQKEFNRDFISKNKISFTDPLKENTVKNAFVNSRLLMIYGAAGTGKTTLINYISNLMSGQRKLFLTKTHTALQNLKRRIENPGTSYDFVSIDSFTKKVELSSYDIIFIDECSTIDNRTMVEFLKKIDPDTFVVLAGDIYQIESIDFGNWFYYAKHIVKGNGVNVELLNTWRTQDESLISLWDGVRNKHELITEKLVIDGPFSEDIGSSIFEKTYDDEVVLCLNYDGKFGLNNMNMYFQNANRSGEPVYWNDWTYKVGDYILFNDTKRFTVLYNNLKGRIVGIEKYDDKIIFTIDVYTIITERACRMEGIEYISTNDNITRIKFEVYSYGANPDEDDSEAHRISTVVPFQLAYAVSIHKAQGLEYDSVKIVIPNSNSEKITHSVFYTAITRAKKHLKIYWSSETMKDIVGSFSADSSQNISLGIVKQKLNIE